MSHIQIQTLQHCLSLQKLKLVDGLIIQGTLQSRLTY